MLIIIIVIVRELERIMSLLEFFLSFFARKYGFTFFINFTITIALILFIRSKIELEAIATIAHDNRPRTIVVNWSGPKSLTNKRQKKTNKQ